MSKQPTLLSEIEQLFYSYAPQALHKKVFLDVVKKWEDAYQARINELESPALLDEFNRMVSEGGNSKTSERLCECAAITRPPCRYCEMNEEEYEEYDMRGSRYGAD